MTDYFKEGDVGFKKPKVSLDSISRITTNAFLADEEEEAFSSSGGGA